MKYANTCICVFSGSGTSQCLGSNQKAVFFDKVLYNSCSNFFLDRFVPKNGVPKNGFPIVFSKSDLGGGDIFCDKKKYRIRETPTLLTDADSRTDTNFKMLHDLSS